jgi:ubiquinone/menaquinone biosynthesis C-methylase UbiE
MSINDLQARFLACLTIPISISGNFADQGRFSGAENQDQTNSVFSEKWSKYDRSDEQVKLYAFQLEWYLKLYGFETEDALRKFLKDKTVIFDAGCGLGYKAAWFASLAPHALVIGMDFSEAAAHAAARYRDIPNLIFVRGDIANTGFAEGVITYTSCDQVIMHTEDPDSTFKELSRITNKDFGQVACYFYAKKALPRELLDDYFRIHCKTMSNADLWAMSEQLAELGKRLSDLDISFEAPDIPELGIKGGTYDIQRFIYWNFMKCFWNPDLGPETSTSTNFDWYSPSNARRFSREDVERLVGEAGMDVFYFHSEEAAYSGRFVHKEQKLC